MADIKKKFIDILFEDEDEESEALEIEKKVNKEKSFETKKESTINAKDILYRKPGASVFVNLDETPNNYNKEEKESNDIYEMSSQISPIFGVIKESKPKNVTYDKDIIDTQTNKPVDSHLDIITSPIYGYGSKEDAMANNYDVKGIEEADATDEELHNLFDTQDLAGSLKKVNYTNDDDIDFEDISSFKLFGDK